MDQTVTLTDTEWAQLMAVLANATGPGITWAAVNPLLMRLGEQLRAQAQGTAAGLPAMSQGDGLDPDPSVRRQRAARTQ